MYYRKIKPDEQGLGCKGSKNCEEQAEWMRIVVYPKDIPPRPTCDKCRRTSVAIQRLFNSAGKEDILDEMSQCSTEEEFIEYARSLIWDYRCDQIEKDDLEYIFSLKSEAFDRVLFRGGFISNDLDILVDLDPEEERVRILRCQGLIDE